LKVARRLKKYQRRKQNVGGKGILFENWDSFSLMYNGEGRFGEWDRSPNCTRSSGSLMMGGHDQDQKRFNLKL